MLALGLVVKVVITGSKAKAARSPQNTRSHIPPVKVHLDQDTPEKKITLNELAQIKQNVRESLQRTEPILNADKPDLPALLRDINKERERVGLAPVKMDPDLCKNCGREIVNLALNGDLDEPFVSVATAGDETIPACIANHQIRERLLNPLLKKIGLHAGVIGGGRMVTVLDLKSGAGKAPSFAIVYPIPDQKDVPHAFPGNEIPNPVPELKRLTAGYPITITFPKESTVRKAKATLTLHGKEVPVWFSSPEKPANPKYPRHQGSTVCMIAKEELEPKATYKVEASAEVNGEKWTKTWSFTTVSQQRFGKDLVPMVFRRINDYRKLAGTDAITQDVDMMKVAQDHANYLALNEEDIRRGKADTHSEDPKRPGYTKKGAELSAYSHIDMAPFDGIKTINSWMAQFHYRIAVLEPIVQKAGIGVAHGPRMTHVVVLPGPTALVQGAPPKPPAIYPADKQTGVPTHYQNGETPTPIPDNKKKLAGFPISVHFFYDVKVKQISAKITLDGKDVPFSLTTPAKPLMEGFQRQSVYLIPDEPLKRASTYKVEIKGVVDGKAWARQWQFTTWGTPQDLKAQNQLVIDAINELRAKVGLTPVTFDAELSKSCYDHANYLLQNWGRPEVAGLGIHDEKPNLPGYTKEGRIAGQASIIASGTTPEDAVTDWIATLYHRIPLLNPDLKRVGIGHVRGGPDNWIVVVDTGRGVKESSALLYPTPNQTDVPVRGFRNLQGFPITITFPTIQKVTTPKVILRDEAENRIEVQLMVPEGDNGSSGGSVTMTAIPRMPLEKGKTYSVNAAARVGDRFWFKRWSFTTAK